MSLIISTIGAVLFSALCAKPLRAMPWLFYLLAVLIAVAGIYFTLSPPPNQVLRAVVFAIQKGQVGFALFVVVMFVGVFSQDSAVRRALNPVRAELSIVAAILIIGHFTLYLGNYLSLATQLFSRQPSIISSFLIALVMLVLLVILTITSFNAVKRRMDAGRWKGVQRLAYLFFGLIFLHLLGYLMIPVLGGSPGAVLNVTVYTVVFAAYAILRVRKALRDRQSSHGDAEASGLKPIANRSALE
jgi:DMSO/TMAO reductase YedYZ heme-binding membrane subunit